MRISALLFVLVSAAVANAAFTGSLNQDAHLLLTKAIRQTRTAANIAGLRNRNVALSELQNQLLNTIQSHAENVVAEISTAIQAGQTAAEQIAALIQNALVQLQSLGENIAAHGQQLLQDLFNNLLTQNAPSMHFQRARVLVVDLDLQALFEQALLEYLHAVGIPENQLQIVITEVMQNFGFTVETRGVFDGLGHLAQVLSNLLTLAQSTAGNTFVAVQTLVQSFLSSAQAAGEAAVSAAAAQLLDLLKPVQNALGPIYTEVQNVINQILTGRPSTSQLQQNANQKSLSELTSILSQLVGLVGATADNTHVAVHTLVRGFLSSMAAAGGMAMDAAGQLLLNFLYPFKWLLGTIYDQVESAVTSILGGGRQLIIPPVIGSNNDLPSTLEVLRFLALIEPNNVLAESIVALTVGQTVQSFVDKAVAADIYSSTESAAQALLDYLVPFQTELGKVYDFAVALTGSLYLPSALAGKSDLEKGIISGITNMANVVSTLIGLAQSTAGNTHVAVQSIIQQFLSTAMNAGEAAVSVAASQLLNFIRPFQNLLGGVYTEVQNAINQFLSGTGLGGASKLERHVQPRGFSDFSSILSQLIGIMGSTAGNTAVAVQNLVQGFISNMVAAGGMAANAAGQLLLDFLSPFQWMLGSVYDLVESAVLSILTKDGRRSWIISNTGSNGDLQSTLDILSIIAAAQHGQLTSDFLVEATIVTTIARTVQNFVSWSIATNTHPSAESAAQALLDAIAPLQDELKEVYDWTALVIQIQYFPNAVSTRSVSHEKGIIGNLANILSTLIGMATSTAGNTHVAVHTLVQQFLSTAVGAGQAAAQAAGNTLLNFIRPFQSILGGIYEQVVQAVADIVGNTPALEI
ncbi:uncharacterized protein LOC129599440 [Paramacrobiotus metropolitanus]|uniref:uncharacterized protein LOC129599440 n=1 Tax=Paramacrobiotus metropolitanus TaxID=2943436 RepID=UPI0024460684|nr:uncharacterized protein LOC129599440 [Paramacrobiotus metropolitanus]